MAFGDDAVGLMRPICNRSLGPICWGVAPAQIGENVTMPVAVLSRDDDTRLVSVFSGGRQRDRSPPLRAATLAGAPVGIGLVSRGFCQ